ncbi:MAG: hypothetical protein ACOH1V_07115 [Stenotrophomonas sp.]
MGIRGLHGSGWIGARGDAVIIAALPCRRGAAKDARYILGRELRHTIERVSPEAAKPEEPTPQD